MSIEPMAQAVASMIEKTTGESITIKNLFDLEPFSKFRIWGKTYISLPETDSLGSVCAKDVDTKEISHFRGDVEVVFIPETVGTKKCKKCGMDGKYGYNNTHLNDFVLYRKDKRGKGPKAYENVCKDCRREGIYKKQGYTPKTRRKYFVEERNEAFGGKHPKECININNPPIHVKHSSLKREGDSLYKSECPACNDGLLLVIRDADFLLLQKDDRCLLCGQHFIYDDIDEMRYHLG